VNGKKRRAVASGRLKAGLEYTFAVKRSVGTISFGADPSLGIYPQVVETGRKAFPGNPSKTPPIGSIMEWMKVKNIRPRSKTGSILSNTYTPTRGKNKGKTVDRRWHIARLISKKINEKGIPGLFYYRDAIIDALNQNGSEFIKAVADEIIRLEVGKFETTTTTIKI
jgi:hypothetical protein